MNTDRHRTDHRDTLPDFSKLTPEELDELADDLYEASKYLAPLVTPDLLDKLLSEDKPVGVRPQGTGNPDVLDS